MYIIKKCVYYNLLFHTKCRTDKIIEWKRKKDKEKTNENNRVNGDIGRLMYIMSFVVWKTKTEQSVNIARM